MKNLIITIALATTILPYCNYAQTNNSTSPKVKLSNLYLGLGGGIPNIGGVSTTFILSNDWGGSISYKVGNSKAKNLPSNYRVGAFCIFGDCIPRDEVMMFSAKIVRTFPTSDKNARFGIEVGPSWNSYKIYKFTPRNATGLFSSWSSNYNKSYEKTNSIGLSLRAKVDILFSRSVGMELALFSNINAAKSVFGAECYFTFGKVSNKQKSKKKERKNKRRKENGN